jgi:menaquinone-9 beta-reductase
MGLMDGSYDAVVVGAGPGGATAAYHLAARGRRVLVADKARFPREKVCGDGLTPRAVRCFDAMGLPTAGPEWARVDGLRIIGAGRDHGDGGAPVVMEFPWPQLGCWPDFGLVRTRLDLDATILDRARKEGAEVAEETEVTGAIVQDGVVRGVTAKRDGEPLSLLAPVVIAADGASSRLGTSLGGRRIERRPMGVAVRTYFRSPRWTDTYLESYLELWQGQDLLPGYGWIFPLPDGTVNVGLGLLNTSKHFGHVDYKRLLDGWLAALSPEWELTPDNRVGRVRGGPLPMGVNRAPIARPGLMLIGDAAGVVNPFNGEGIAYALETAEMAAAVADEAIERDDPRALRAYPERVREAYEGYFILGRAFVRLIGNGAVMRTLTRYGLPHPRFMRFAFKILANLTDPRDGGAGDRVIDAMCRAAPAVRRLVA